MKLFSKTAAAALATLVIAGPGYAHERAPSFSKISNSHAVMGNVLESYPIYSEAKQKEVCEKVKVPVYGGIDKNKQTGDVVAGAVIGGIFGQAITGNKNGAATGAVIGALAGANNQHKQVVGYRWETQCNVVETASHVMYYESRIRLEGKIYRVRTDYQIQSGSTVKMYVHSHN